MHSHVKVHRIPCLGRRIVCRSNARDRMVFELFPGMGAVSVEDARETYEMCRSIDDEKQKEACYAMFGIDGKNVEKYLTVVEDMEMSYRRMLDEEEKKRSTRFELGPFVIHICWKCQTRK